MTWMIWYLCYANQWLEGAICDVMKHKEETRIQNWEMRKVLHTGWSQGRAHVSMNNLT
jgi:hypothetical protein